MASDLSTVLHQNSWFQTLPEPLQKAFIGTAKLQCFELHAVLHAKGQQPNGLFCIHSGKIRISNFTPDGKEVVLTWLTAGDWFGEISSFDNLPRTHCATVDETAQIVVLPHQGFARLCEQHPEIYRYFVPIFCQRIRALFELVDEARTLPIKFQLVKRLLHLKRAATGPGTGIEVSQESLALMLNTTRQSVNRWLNELQAENLIHLSYNKIAFEFQTLQDYLHNVTLN